MLPIFAALDADKDGEISSAEIENAAVALKTLDKNKDGKLDEDELRPDFGGMGGAGRGGDPEERAKRTVDQMMKSDKNEDGKLAMDEIPERMKNMAKQIDANKDDQLDREEIMAWAKSRGARGGRGGGGFGGRGGEGGGRGGRGGEGGGGGRRPARPE